MNHVELLITQAIKEHDNILIATIEELRKAKGSYITENSELSRLYDGYNKAIGDVLKLLKGETT